MALSSNPGPQVAGPTVDVGGVPVTQDQLTDAISILENDHSTSVKQPLKYRAHPLWQADYHAVAEKYRSEHPEEELPPGTPQDKMPRVKTAFTKRLEDLRDSFAHEVPEGIQSISPVEQAVAAAENQVQQETDAEPLPGDDYDARQRVYRQIVRRRGQPKFRSLLMHAYSHRCAITGYTAADALEAAHLRPYRGPESNTVCNGLLLRADIHTLLDLKLLAINPQTRQVVVSERLSGTEYESLSGIPLREPWLASQRPSQESLEYLWQEFRKNED